MAISRAFSLALAAILATTCNAPPIQAADVARLGAGGGHLASREGDSDWQGLRSGDSLPAKGHLRTSPAGPVRIEMPSGALFLAGDTDVDLDVASRRVVIERGRILFRSLGDEGALTVVAGATTFVCTPGSEAEISFAETIGVNVLMGGVQVTAPNGVAGQLVKEPLEWVGNELGVANSSVPTADDWATRIRRRTEPREVQGLGQLIAKDAQSDSPVRLEVARYHVNVVLQPPVALVQIDQSFFNPYGQQNEGTFVFNLPEGASVSRFAMFVTPDNLIEGELIDRKRADQVYTSIVTRKRDPAILEQIGSNLFRMRVFPIFARDTKRILLDFTIPLVAERGRYHFELPLMSDLKPIWDFGIAGVINPPFMAGSVSSRSHPRLEFVEGTDGSLSFSQQAQDVTPPPNLVVDFRSVDDRNPTVRTFATESGHQHFVVTLPESANPAPMKPPGPTDLLVLVDTSGSAVDLNKARLAARTLVNNLRPQDRWQMGSVDIGYRPMTSDWQSPRTKEARAALRQLDEAFALGASNLDAAVLEALAVFSKSPQNRRRVIVYLGDGEAVISPNGSCWKNDAFRGDNPNRAEFHAVKLGDERSSGKWLREGTRLSKGRVFDIRGRAGASGDLFEWALMGMPLATPIESCEIQNVPAEDLFYDSTWPTGRELHIFGRGKVAKTLELKLKLANLPGRVNQIRLKDQQREEDVFAGRLWARLKLESLVAETSNDDNAGIASIVRLAQEWSLMSPYTAFLVLETEQDYSRWDIPRALRHRYWKPLGAAEASPVHEYLRQLAARRGVVIHKESNALTLTDRQRLQVQDHLRAVKRALAERNPVTAINQLSAIRIPASLVDLKAYESLLSEAQSGLHRDSTLYDLRLWQMLSDRRAPDPIAAIAPLVLRYSRGGVNSEYYQRHPHTTTLLKPAPEFKSERMTLEEFAREIQDSTGIPIVIDKKSLSDEGISLDNEVLTSQIRGFLLGTAINLVLEPRLLTLIPENRIWRITTRTQADDRLYTNVYPIVDLLRSDALPVPSRLANRILDIESDEQGAMELRLKQQINANYLDIPLGDALTNIFEQLQTAKFWVDQRAMADEGISVDTPVTLALDKLPAELVLKELLSPLLLDYVFRDGVLRVTTMTAADDILETRVYSAAGIVDETPDYLNSLSKFGFRTGERMRGEVIGGWGMGGMGGGFFGGGIGMMGGGVANNIDAIAGIAMDGQVSPPLLDDEAAEPEEAASPDPQLDRAQIRSKEPQTFVDDLTAQIIRQNTPCMWDDRDWNGGSIIFHPPSFAYVIRQTRRGHVDVKELFTKLRRQPRAARIGTSILSKQNGRDADMIPNYMNLMRVIEKSTPGKWEYHDAEWGWMLPHPLARSLVVRHTERGHEEIDRLLTQLRRARCVAESLPWQTSLEGIDDQIRYFDCPNITDLPRNHLDAKPADPTLVDQVKSLAIRKVSTSINQRWRNVAVATSQGREIKIRKQGARLEFVLADRTMRAEGPRAAVAYPGLTLVEIDAWGDAVRQLADASLPWLPHRSNEELALLFDVTVESEDAKTTTLRLTFPGHADTYLKASFSKQTGAPVKWQSILADETQYELQFAETTILAVDASGKQLERWELLADEPALVLPALDEGWGDFFIVEPSKPDAPLAKARELLRRGENAAATKALANLLKDRPQQPLLNFLYAQSIGISGEFDPALARSQRDALGRVAAASPRDLLNLVTPSSFSSIGAGPLRELFLAVPEERRTDDLWELLSEFAVELNRVDLALQEIERAITLTSDDSTRARRQILRVELLLKNARPFDAEVAAKSLVVRGVSPMQMVEIGDLFARADLPLVSNFFFDRYRETGNLSPQEQSECAYRQARWLKKGEFRWRLLMIADANRNDPQHQLIGEILSEADDSRDAANLGKLVAELQSGIVQTQLMLKQAELTDDKRQAADIVSKLYEEKRLPESKLEWGISVLDGDQRANEVVEIIERHLRKMGKIKVDWLNYLADAYKTLGRDADYRRAISDHGETGRMQKARTR